MTAVRYRQYVWLTLVLGLLASPCLCSAQGQGAARGLLFEIRPNPTSRPSYLLGTIHSEDPRVTQLPPPVKAAFDASPRFALEVEPHASAIIEAMMVMTYTDGRQLRDALPPALYRDVCAALEELGMTEDAFRDFKPWAVMIQLSTPSTLTGEFLDMKLYRLAMRQHKQIQGLETIEEQLAIFDDLSEADQVAFLEEAVATRADLPNMLEQLILAYLDRDLARLQAISDASLEAADPRLAALFRATVIDVRNRRMAERMQPLLDEGGWLIAVGALHLAGETGVVRLLRSKGYSVKRIY